jgi:uncharacterized protein YoxC
MPVLLQICLVIVTIAVAAIAIVTVRAMKRFETAAHELTETLQSVQTLVPDVQKLTAEAHEIVASVGSVVPRFRAVAERFEDVGERTARLSSDLLEQVEAPLHTAVAIARGMRRGTGSLFDKLMHRFAHQRSRANGGFQDE